MTAGVEGARGRLAVAFLQNMWFRDPDKARALFRRRPDMRHDLIARFLFSGQNFTGRRLRRAFGDACNVILWEEASLEIGGRSSSVFPADPEHIAAVLKRHNPRVVLAFGEVAGGGVREVIDRLHRELGFRFRAVYGPHPAAHAKDVPDRLAACAVALTAALEKAEQARRNPALDFGDYTWTR